MVHTAWLASYPKSGNTWVRTLLDALVFDDDPNLNGLDRSGGNDGIQGWLGISVSGLSEAEAIAVERLSWVNAESSHMAYFLRKTHHAWTIAADGFPARWQPRGARAIYVARDPRAVAVSWAHHNGVSHAMSVASMAGETESRVTGLSSNLRAMQEGLGSWSSHVNSWRDQQALPLYFLTYEQLSADPVTTLASLAQWLEIDTDRAACTRAVERCSFNRLAVREVETGFVEAASVERVFFRRGLTDSWRDELSPELAARIEEDHGPLMRELGYLD